MAQVYHPNKTSMAIMKLVHGYFTRTRKPWTLMSQNWMLGKLNEWYGLKISRSTLNYNLAILRQQGLVDTITRHKRDPRTGHFICQVTLYKATKTLKKFFSALARYFQRCGWVPDIKSLAKGCQPVVGAATTPDKVHAAYLEEKRRRGRR